MTRLILASASPRRAELLRRAGLAFEARPADVDESHAGLPREATLAAARRKAEAARAVDAWTLGADTEVVVDGEALGKPADAAAARAMLARLSGRAHAVVTGVCVIAPDGRAYEDAATTRVRFARLPPAAIEAYVASGEPLGKAGAYAIQGAAEAFVERIEGSWSNVVGLPLATAVALLARAGYPLPAHLARQAL